MSEVVKLKPAIKKLWIEALRSGEYKQTQGELRNQDNEFCCLGVLCNLHAQAHPKIAKQQTSLYKYLNHTGDLPDLVIKWAFESKKAKPEGVFREYDDSAFHGGFITLMALNDDLGYSFKQIANVIDRYL